MLCRTTTSRVLLSLIESRSKIRLVNSITEWGMERREEDVVKECGNYFVRGEHFKRVISVMPASL